MNEFYQKVSELPTDMVSYLLTGLDGDIAGEKGIISDGTLIFETKKGSFDVQRIEGISQSEKPGIQKTKFGNVFFEKHGTLHKMIICGGGHVGVAMVSIAKMLNFEITVIEDRPAFADNARRAGADNVICENFANACKMLNTDLDTYILILTRGHRHDADCLRGFLGKPYGYLGMIGSRARVKKMKEDLTEEGFNRAELEQMYSPIGLSIGAGTPQEIAISIAAQIIEIKNKSGKSAGFEKEVSDFLFDREQREETVVLATIVGRKGSAPRDIGTKMIIRKDGRTLGTIGGGCVEADICTRARHLLSSLPKEPKNQIQVVTADLTGRDAEEEGMVCGGILHVSLEVI